MKDPLLSVMCWSCQPDHRKFVGSGLYILSNNRFQLLHLTDILQLHDFINQSKREICALQEFGPKMQNHVERTQETQKPVNMDVDPLFQTKQWNINS